MDGADFKHSVDSNEKEVVSDWLGKKYLLTHCNEPKAQESWTEALGHVQKKKQRSMETGFRLMYSRFVNGQRMSKDSLVKEATLSGTGGKGGGNDLHYYAFKKIPVRSYFWHSPGQNKTAWVSHYRYKNFQKLSSSDTNRVRENFRDIEGY